MRNESGVDVVVPLYNKRAYIQRALKSILSQTYSPDQIIVVDDGSTDGGEDLVARIPDSRILLIKQPNQGPGAARNAGFAAGCAKYVAFLDADDEWTPTFLQRCIEILEENPACALCNTSWFEEPSGITAVEPQLKNGIEHGVWRCPTTMSAERLKAAVDFCHSSAIVAQRNAIAKMGGYFSRDHCTYGEDSYLWIRILLHYPVYRVMEPLIRFHFDSSALGFGRRDPHPEPPLLKYAGEVMEECPASYKALLRRYLAFYALFVGSRMSRREDPQRGLRFLIERVSFIDLEKELHFRYVKALIRAMFFAIMSSIHTPRKPEIS